MKTTTPTNRLSIFGLVCTTFGHDYIVTRKVTDHINEYKCAHCGREVTDNMSGNIEVLTSKIKQVNSTVSSFLQKRSRILSTH